MIKNENFIVIQGWMINELQLTGNDLLIYAIIYGFSQTEGTKFTGSLKYLMSCTGASKPTVIKSLKQLLERGLIIKETKEKNGVKFNAYLTTSKETLPGVVKKLYQGGKEILPNNIDNNIINNLDIETVKNTTPSEQPNSNSSGVVSSTSSSSPSAVVGSKGESRGGGGESSDFVRPTLDEVRSFVREEGLTRVSAYEFWDYYEKNGWTWNDKGIRRPLKNWRKAATGWESRAKKEEKSLAEQRELDKKLSGADPYHPEEEELTFEKWLAQKRAKEAQQAQEAQK